ncbi:MAG TPA: hypothetical protein VEY70_20840 [Metabacillus sp.]|nr:hypothetical protein [Metabacillus sp.]
MKFIFYNDTGREVIIHPATEIQGTKCDMSVIKPLEERTFYLPENTYPSVKMWDYGERNGLSIFVLPQQDSD